MPNFPRFPRNRFTGMPKIPREVVLAQREVALRHIEAINEDALRTHIDTVLWHESRDFLLVGDEAGAELREMVYGSTDKDHDPADNHPLPRCAENVIPAWMMYL